jgi:hypothetical protein
VLADSGAAAVLVDDAFAPVVAAARTPEVRTVLTLGAGYDAQLAAAPAAPAWPPVADEAPCPGSLTATSRRCGGVLVGCRARVDPPCSRP